MSENFKKISIALGGILVGSVFMYTTSLSNGQVVEVFDDGVKPVDEQKVIITTTQTKAVETIEFDGTLFDLVNEQLPKAIIVRDQAIAEVARIEALIKKVESETSKLPEREK